MQAGIHDVFIEKFTAAVNELKVVDGVNENVDIGPLINQSSVDKVANQVADALSKGATLVTGGKELTEEGGHEGLEAFLESQYVSIGM